MKILATSDIHGNRLLIYQIKHIILKENIEALIIAGDIAPKGFYQLYKNGPRYKFSSAFSIKNINDILNGDEQLVKTRLDLLGFVDIPKHAYNLSTIKSKQKEKLIQICELLKMLDIPVYMLIGNDDHIPDEEWNEILNSFGIFNLNLRTYSLKDLKVVGFQYVLPTPWNTNNELPEDALAKKIKNIKNNVDRKTILITHGPPKSILDRLVNGFHAGSESIYNLVKDRQPVFHIFGHIHEAFGTARIRDTICCNVSCLWTEWILRGYIIDTETRSIKKVVKRISVNDLKSLYKELLFSSSDTTESERERAGW